VRIVGHDRRPAVAADPTQRAMHQQRKHIGTLV
jgi:hypothetical protein